MKFKKLLGIFFFLTLISTTVFGSIAENPRQGFDGIFTELHQGVTLSKAATAPGLSACFLESSRQVFLLGQGGKALSELTRAQASRMKSIQEIAHNWASRNTLGIKDPAVLQTHLQKIKDGIAGLFEHRQALSESLNNPNLSNSARQTIQSGISLADDLIEQGRVLLRNP
jgi:hypothetical protein